MPKENGGKVRIGGDSEILVERCRNGRAGGDLKRGGSMSQQEIVRR